MDDSSDPDSSAAPNQAIAESELPDLSESARRKLATEWNDLAMEWGDLVETHPEHPVVPAVIIAKKRFKQLRSAFLPLWAEDQNPRLEEFSAWLTQISVEVAADVAQLWESQGPQHLDRFQREYRGKLDNELSRFVRTETGRIRRLIVKHRANPHFSLGEIVATNGDLDSAASRRRWREAGESSTFMQAAKDRSVMEVEIKTYLHQHYPKVKRHWNGKEVTVKNPDEEVGLGGGWADSPGAFAPYRGPRPMRTEQQIPTEWLAEWRVPGLSPDLRKRIQAHLLRADSAFDRSPDKDAGALAAMRQAFDGVAKVFFDAGILTEELLRKVVPPFVWDSAIAGGWWRLAAESRQDIFPEPVGHYWIWREDNAEALGLFRAEIRHWEAELLDAPSQSPEILSDAGDMSAGPKVPRIPVFPAADQPPSVSPGELGSVRKSPKEFVDVARRSLKLRSYEKLAARIGIGKDTLYAITKENRWVSDGNYILVAQVCKCEPKDLYPRDIPRPPSRP